MSRQPIQKIYVPAPDYDDPIPDEPEPESLISPTNNSSYYYPDYQRSAHSNRDTQPPQNANISQSPNKPSIRQFEQEQRQRTSTQSSTASNAQSVTAKSRRLSERPNQIIHRYDTGYGSTDSTIPDDYQYRIEKLVPSPKQTHHSKEDIKRYIKAVGGVPIIPPPLPKDQPIYPPVTPSIDVSDNLAFKQHVKNHRRFDTLGSFRSCENCAICKSYLGDADRIQIASLEKRKKNPKKEQRTSPIISGEAYQKIEEDAMKTLNALDQYMVEDNSRRETKAVTELEDFEPEEPEPSEMDSEESDEEQNRCKGLEVQALIDVKGRNPDEIDARQGEILKVLTAKSLFWKVRNSKGRTGWIPIQYIYIVKENE